MTSFTVRLPDSTGVRPIWHGHIPSNGKGNYKAGGISPSNEREMQLIRKASAQRIEARQAMNPAPAVRLNSLPTRFQRRLVLGLC